MFSLSKDDILGAVRDYPEAERILIEYGKRRLNKNQTKITISPSSDDIEVPSETSTKLVRRELIKEPTIPEEELPIKRTHSKKLKDISKLKELNTISEEISQRAPGSLTTDMLGIPTLNNIKHQNSDEILADYFANANEVANSYYNNLQKLLNKL